MDRRSFLTGSAYTLATLVSRRVSRHNAPTINIEIEPDRSLGAIPASFTGLGYEISSIAIPGLLSPTNHSYVELARALGTKGVVRVGGNTSDYSSFRSNGNLVSSPKATVINAESLRRLRGFLDATGWQLIWGLNLGSGTEHEATLEAQAVSAAVASKLLAFEIGNEPDLFAHEGHRPAGYSYEQYLQEFRHYKSEIRNQLPTAPFAGPDVAVNTDWAVRFAQDEGHDLELLTHHYYRGGASNPRSSLEELLAPAPKLSAMLDAMRAASREAGIPYRIVETNSFSGGGKRGVSDTFGSALWALDYMFTLASHGAAGLNMETGMNQLGFVSPYSPIINDKHGHYTPAPDYYGMLAFSPFAGGELLAVDHDAPALNATVYAVKRDGDVLVAIINKDSTTAVEATISVPHKFRHANATRLTGPSLESTTGITLGGSSSSAVRSYAAGSNRGYRLQVPASSAALVTLHGK